MTDSEHSTSGTDRFDGPWERLRDSILDAHGLLDEEGSDDE